MTARPPPGFPGLGPGGYNGSVMDKRTLLKISSFPLSDGREVPVYIYRKKNGTAVSARMCYGFLDIYLPYWGSEGDALRLARKYYLQHPDRNVFHPYYKEGVYIYVLGSKRYFTRDRSLRENPAYFFYPSTSKDPLIRYRKEFASFLVPEAIRIGREMGKDLRGFTLRTGQYLSYYGCCYPKKQMLKFDYRLYSFRPEMIDAILVHEIAHLDEIHHNDRFYQIVHRYCPDYDALEEAVNRSEFDYGGEGHVL